MHNYIRKRLAITPSKLRETVHYVSNRNTKPHNNDPFVYIHRDVLDNHQPILESPYLPGILRIINFHTMHHVPFGILKGVNDPSSGNIHVLDPFIQEKPHLELDPEHLRLNEVEHNRNFTKVRPLQDGHALLRDYLSYYMPKIYSHWLANQVINSSKEQEHNTELTKFLHPMFDYYKDEHGYNWEKELHKDLFDHHLKHYTDFLKSRFYADDGMDMPENAPDRKPGYTLIHHYQSLPQDLLTDGILHYAKQLENY